MKKFTLSLLLLSSMIFLFNSCGKSEELTQEEIIENEVLTLINQHRQSIQLNPVEHDDFIAELSKEHAQALANDSNLGSHDGFSDRAHAIWGIYGQGPVGEIVVYTGGIDIANSMVALWLNSEGHRNIIETPDHNFAGVGVASNEGNSYRGVVLFYSSE